jgi:hypothetical protein
LLEKRSSARLLGLDFSTIPWIGQARFINSAGYETAMKNVTNVVTVMLQPTIMIFHACGDI